MLVTEQPGSLKFLSLGATGMKTSGGMNRFIANPGHCRHANGRIVEVTTKSGLLPKRELGMSKRNPKLQSLNWLTPWATLCRAGQRMGGSVMEGQGDQDLSFSYYFISHLLSHPWALILGLQMGNDYLGPRRKSEQVPRGQSLGSEALAAIWKGEAGECTGGWRKNPQACSAFSAMMLLQKLKRERVGTRCSICQGASGTRWEISGWTAK